MTPPSAADIRAAMATRWTQPVEGGLSLADAFSDAFGTAATVTDELWDTDDFRPTELERFDELLSEATRRIREQRTRRVEPRGRRATG